MLCASQSVRAAQEEALAAVQQRSAAVRAVRRPLVRRSTKAAAVRMFNPRFEEEFAAGKDYDPDRCVAHRALRHCVCESDAARSNP